jgi:hypothetical protein
MFVTIPAFTIFNKIKVVVRLCGQLAGHECAAVQPKTIGTARQRRPTNYCSALEIFAPPIIVPSCRFTSFIVKSARATAKSSSAPAIGREPHARIAVQRNCPRNFPCSPPPAPAVAMMRRPVMAAGGVAVAVIATGIDVLKRKA